MKIGMGWALMNPARRPDERVYRDALELLELAEPLGFSSLWTVEHHFTGHSPVPDPLQLLAYAAARTSEIELGTAVLVLPWHDPMRVAEQIAMLDVLSGGRTRIGFGRGSSAVEYDGFGIPRDEGHARLAEGIDFVVRALTEEPFRYEGQFYRCGGLTVRPRPVHHPERHFHCAAHSPASAALTGAAGLRLLYSPETEEGFTDNLLATYHKAAAEHGHQVGGASIHLYVSVAGDHDQARERARTFMAPMVESLAAHYQARVGDIISPARHTTDDDLEVATERFMAKHVIGTPDECVAQLLDLHARYGFEQFIGEFSYGDMPVDLAKDNLTLFADKVMPELRTA